MKTTYLRALLLLCLTNMALVTGCVNSQTSSDPEPSDASSDQSGTDASADERQDSEPDFSIERDSADDADSTLDLVDEGNEDASEDAQADVEADAEPPSGCMPQSYDALTQMVANVGQADADSWLIWSNGHIETTHDFDALTTRLRVRAKGSRAGGQWAQMKVEVNGEDLGTRTVDTDTFKHYEFGLPAGLGQGATIRVSFINDALINGEDRNLYVQGVDLDCEEVMPPVMPPATGGKAQTGPFNYAEALQKSLIFFSANQMGTLSPMNALSWRADTTLDGVYSGGYADAGDNILFGKNFGATLAALAWTAYQLRDEAESSGQMPRLLDSLKHGTDWIMDRAHTVNNGATVSLVAQMSDRPTDHFSWLSIEQWQGLNRPVYQVTPSQPGSDVAALYSAALAASSLAFRPYDVAYADRLLDQAKILYTFATSHRGLMQAHINTQYQNSNGDGDELAYAAIWLYRATNIVSYLNDAKANHIAYYGNWAAPSYEHQEVAAGLLIAMYSNDTTIKNGVKAFIDGYRTDGGHGGAISCGANSYCFFNTGWGSFANGLAAAFIASMYADHYNDTQAQAFAANQMNFVLGNNPNGRSYMGGFGNNPPTRYHHRSASGGSNAGAPTSPNMHVLVGAVPLGVVSGPTDFDDHRDKFKYTEVTTLVNAVAAGTLTYLYGLQGGYPVPLNQIPGTR